MLFTAKKNTCKASTFSRKKVTHLSKFLNNFYLLFILAGQVCSCLTLYLQPLCFSTMAVNKGVTVEHQDHDGGSTSHLDNVSLMT